ncbi:MAG: glycosyltransferase family 4 protein [Fimbriimonadaceae bacterium]|nr:glycosyltransferase family 4 protein [Fimbriimonadaceae bacterium]
MKVLHIASSMPDDWGGIERYVATLSAAQAAQGVEVEVAAWPGSPLSRRLLVPQVPARVPRKFRLAGLPDYLRLFSRQRYDVVVPHFSPDYDVPLVAARLCGQRGVVVTRHLALPLRRSRARSLARLADGFVGVSQAAADSLVASGIDPERVAAVHGGCEPLRPQSDAVVTRRNFGMDGFCVGFFGRLVEEKGVLVAAEALRSVPGARLHVFGDGPLRPELQSMGHISVHGKVDGVADAMAAVDAVVLPSLWAEAFSVALLEAMSLGKPIVASAVGGVPEAVADGTEAVLVQPGQATALAGAIRWMVDDPERAARLGRAAKSKFFATYTPVHMARRLTEAYHVLTSGVTR